MTRTLVMECRTFVRQKTLPSPRAMDGSNDDRVMAFGIALEMYRQYGTHAKRVKPKTTSSAKRRHTYAWEKKGRVA
jgi:hypothetical protein